MLLEKISEFGTIGEHKRERKDYTLEGGFEYDTEIIAIQVWLQKDIPSFIKLGEQQANVWYLGQSQTCAKCNSKDHMARECPQATPWRWERTVEDKGQTVSQSEKEKEADDVTDEEEEEDGEAGIWTAQVKTVSAARILKSPNPISEKNMFRNCIHIVWIHNFLNMKFPKSKHDVCWMEKIPGATDLFLK